MRTTTRRAVFSTGQAAAVLRCSIQTVIRLIDTGAMPGWKVPGSKFRRVGRVALVEYLAANGLPKEWIDTPHTQEAEQ